jgi:hypothetical protein
MGEATDSSTEVPTVFNDLIWQKLNQAICNQTEVSETFSGPQGFGLMQNYPNPFNPSTQIGFQVADYGLVTLKVYDVLGREVATLVNEGLKAGSHQTTFDATGLASGVYLYRLQAGGVAETKKLLLFR